MVVLYYLQFSKSNIRAKIHKSTISALLFLSRVESWILSCFALYTGCLYIGPCVLIQSVLFVSFLSTHQLGAWPDSLGTDVNKLCLRKSQTQNVCEHYVFNPTCHCWCFTHVLSQKWHRNLNLPFLQW